MPLDDQRSSAQSAEWREGVHRTVIFNVKYSPNLGDGVIAQCLETELAAAHPQIQALSIDLANRKEFTARASAKRSRQLALLACLPVWLRKWLVPKLLLAIVRLRYVRDWRSDVAEADSVIFGGGALLADADQNFPIKLSEAMEVCRGYGLPVVISCVGASQGWSADGLHRFRRTLLRTKLVSTSFRDPVSAGIWRDYLFPASALPAQIALDPGLLSETVYGRPEIPDPVSNRQRVGICITDPLVLQLHSERRHDRRFIREWLRESTERLAASGLKVVVFTNGSGEDEDFKATLQVQLGGIADISFAPHFREPRELVHFIAGLDTVIGHRLHACIVAYAYRIPAIGLTWDRKLDHFFRLTQRMDYLLNPNEASPLELVELVRSGLADPPNEEIHAHCVDACRQSIANLRSLLLELRPAS